MKTADILKLALTVLGIPGALFGMWKGISEYMDHRAIQRLNVEVLQCEVAAMKRKDPEPKCWEIVTSRYQR